MRVGECDRVCVCSCANACATNSCSVDFSTANFCSTNTLACVDDVDSCALSRKFKIDANKPDEQHFPILLEKDDEDDVQIKGK